MQQSITMLSIKMQAIAAITIVIGIVLFWVGIFRLTHYFDVSMNSTLLLQAILYLTIGLLAKILGLIICLRNGDNDWFRQGANIKTRKDKNTQPQPEEPPMPDLGLGQTLLGVLLSKVLTVILPSLSFLFGIALIFSKALGIVAVFMFLFVTFILTIAFFEIDTRRKRKMYNPANRTSEIQQENNA